MLFMPEDVMTRDRQRPFTPIQLATSSGEMNDVEQPELIAAGGRFLEVFTPRIGRPGVFGRVKSIAFAHRAEWRDLGVRQAPFNRAVPKEPGRLLASRLAGK
jgi:hypothetical protein